jgi:hypothetical protein
MHNCGVAPWVEVKMLLANGSAGSRLARARRGAQGLFACVALAIAYVLMVAVPALTPAPASAQFGNIHIFIGGGHWRGRHGHSRRHSRHHQKDKDEPEEAASPALPTSPSGASASNPPTPSGTPPTPSGPPGPPAGARPEPRGPNFEPSK